jgi:transposase
MDRGRFVWPVTKTGKVGLTSAQLSMLLEGIDWRCVFRKNGTFVSLNRGQRFR